VRRAEVESRVSVDYNIHNPRGDASVTGVPNSESSLHIEDAKGGQDPLDKVTAEDQSQE